MPRITKTDTCKTYKSRVIRNTKLSSNESNNCKSDWTQWSGKCQKIPPQTPTSEYTQVTEVFSGSKCKNHKNESSGVTKSRTMRNRHSTQLHKVTNVKRSDDQYDSILFNNRFHVFNSAELFPESALTSTNTEANVDCLHVDDKCQLKKNSNRNLRENCTDIRPLTRVAARVNKSTETKVSTTTKRTDENVGGECLSRCKNTNVSDLRRRRLDCPSQGDKYDLDLRFRPRHQNKIAAARNCDTFRNWNNQNCEKFGFIPLGDIRLPPVDLNNLSKENFFDIHRRVKASGTHNFLHSQIRIQSQLKPEVWEQHLAGYWDSQLLLLIKYGFPLDFDYSSPLQSVDKNHTSGIQFTDDIQAYLSEEKSFGAILGPFKESPINDLHISPFITREKPGAPHRRVIVDLSFPHGSSVNDGVKLDTYLGTPFILTLPTIDNITNQVKKLGRGCHLYKIDLSRAFRHIKLDPRDYNLLGLKLNDLYIDSCLPFGFRHGSALLQRLSDAIRFIMAQKGFAVTNYIDDIIGHSVVSKSNDSFNTLRALLVDLGFDISEKKVVQPATKVTCLGVDIDTVEFTVSITPDKVREILLECD